MGTVVFLRDSDVFVFVDVVFVVPDVVVVVVLTELTFMW